MAEGSQAALDLRGVPCPLSFVRAKIYLARIAPRQLLEVFLDAGEPVEQVPNSLAVEGHQIQSIEPRDHFFVLTVQTAARSPIDG
jgi:tRNA 2-thiouridine synthesizing protein A